MPRVSVIMSAYNDEETIRVAVESVLAQTYTDFEFLIMDDASKDGTLCILEKLEDDRITIFRNKENRGLTANLNSLLALSEGEYIFRMDADDICRSDRMEKQVRYMDLHPEVYLAGCDTRDFGDSDLVWHLKDDPEELRIRMLLHPVLAHPSFIFRRALYEEGFSYDETFRTAQDYDLASRVAKKHKIGRVGEILLDYRVHKKQVSAKDPSGQRNNADRVRERLLRELQVSFSEEEKRLYGAWAREEKPERFSDLRKCDLLIPKLVKANEKTKIYDVRIFETVLKKLFYTRLIRTKDPRMILRYVLTWGYGPKDLAVFFGEAFRTVVEKCRNRIFR